MISGPDPKLRFSGRVADYVRWRPGYPDELVDVVAEHTGLRAGWTVADLGAGTGLSSKPFLERGCAVVAVEPNDEMRAAADADLADHPLFRSVPGSAESTGIADASVHLVLAAQAFHWFERSAVRSECLRILREPRWGAVVWNVRRTDADDFAREYEALLERWGTDYARYRARRIDPVEMTAFFGAVPVERIMPNAQVFDFEGLRGRLLSSSYVPATGHPDHEPMLFALAELFARRAEGGVVHFHYDTQLFLGSLR